jgi:hypothetical protein
VLTPQFLYQCTSSDWKCPLGILNRYAFSLCITISSSRPDCPRCYYDSRSVFHGYYFGSLFAVFKLGPFDESYRTALALLQYCLETLLNMDGVQDLFDPRQIALFDAIDELSSDTASDIEMPQLVVVCEQKVCKSSVLQYL